MICNFSDVLWVSLLIYIIVLITGVYIRYKQNNLHGDKYNHPTKISQAYIQLVATCCAILTFAITFDFC